MYVGLNANGLSEQEKLAFLSNDRFPRFRMELLDVTGESKGFITSWVEEGSINVNYEYLRPIKRQIGFTLVEFPGWEIVDFSSDRVRLWVDYCYDRNFLEAGLADDTINEGWLNYSAGIFTLDSASRALTEGARVVKRAVVGYDLSLLLSDDLVNDRYVVDSGDNIVSAAEEVIRSVGLDPDIEENGALVGAVRSWDAGTSKLTIVNELMASIGYGSIYMVDNVVTARRYSAPADREPTRYYATDERSLVGSNISSELDYGSVPNEWIFAVAQVDKPELTYSLQNKNPDSPTSIPARGRVKSYFQSGDVDAADQASLEALVRRKAAEDSSINESVTIETPIMPMHGEADVIALVHTALDIEAKYGETAWSYTCIAGSTMSHTIRRAIDISGDE